jgi:hypothetical protein
MEQFPPCCGTSGRVTNACAERVHLQRVDGSYRFDRDWTGWRMQGHALIGPHGMRFTPQTLALAWRYLTSVEHPAVSAPERLARLANV